MCTCTYRPTYVYVYESVRVYGVCYVCILCALIVTQREKKLAVGRAADRKELFGRDEVGEGDEQVRLKALEGLSRV